MSNSVFNFAICFDKNTQNLFGQTVKLPGTLIIRGDVTPTGPLTTYHPKEAPTPEHLLKLSVRYYNASTNIYFDLPGLSAIPYFGSAPREYTGNPSIGVILSSVLFGLAFNYDNDLSITVGNRLVMIDVINEVIEKMALDMPRLNSGNGAAPLYNCDYTPTTWYHVLERRYKGYLVWCKRRIYNGDVATRWTFKRDVVTGAGVIENKLTVKDQVRFGEQPMLFADVCDIIDSM